MNITPCLLLEAIGVKSWIYEEERRVEKHVPICSFPHPFLSFPNYRKHSPLGLWQPHLGSVYLMVDFVVPGTSFPTCYHFVIHILTVFPSPSFPWEYTRNKDSFSSVQSLSRVRLFATPWTTACQASLCITNSQSLPKLMSIESVMPSNHLILCCPLLLLPSIFTSIRVFSNKSALRIRWPKYWSFSLNISPSNEHQDWSPLGWTGWISLQSKGLSRVFSKTTVQKHQFFGAQLSLWSNSHIHTWLLEKP